MAAKQVNVLCHSTRKEIAMKDIEAIFKMHNMQVKYGFGNMLEGHKVAMSGPGMVLIMTENALYEEENGCLLELGLATQLKDRLIVLINIQELSPELKKTEERLIQIWEKKKNRISHCEWNIHLPSYSSVELVSILKTQSNPI